MLARLRGKPWGRYALCVGLFAWGCWGLANTAVMSYASGAHSADSVLGQWVQPSSALAVDFGVAVLAAVTFALLVRGKVSAFLAGVFMCFVLAAFGAMSVKNTLAFGMIERVEKAERIKVNTNAENTAIVETNKNAAGLQERQLSWLRAEYSRTKDLKEKAALRAEIREASKPVKAEAQTVTTALVDPEAQVLGKRWEMESEDFVYYNQLFMAYLLIAAKVFGFGFASAFWPRKSEAVAIQAPIPVPAPAASVLVVPSAAPAAVAPVPSVPAVANENVPNVQEALALDVPALDSLDGLESPEKRSVISREESNELLIQRRAESVRTFLNSEYEHVHDVLSATRADDVYQHYVGWARRHGHEQMSMMAFSTLLAEEGVRKERRGGSIRYFLRRSAQEVPAQLRLAA